MDIKRLYSRRCFLWVFIVMFILCVSMVLSAYLGKCYLISVLPLSVVKEAAARSVDFKEGLDLLSPFAGYLNDYFIPLLSGVFFMSALILWLILRGSFVRLIREAGIMMQREDKAAKKGVQTAPECPVPDKQEIINANKRFYLHLLSVFQREGRLVDFLAEDLSRYEDAQIGAAVRSVHEGCRKALYKYVKPGAVINKQEGEQVVVPPGFDAGEIKLTGNVTGEPPFNGILRHKGWRAGRVELPALTPRKDSRIIAPAEVEIL